MKKLCLAMGLILCAGVCAGQQLYRIELQPFDFQQQDGADFYLPTIGQIEITPDRIYLRSNQHTQIVAMDHAGKMLSFIGGKGDHPGEFGHFGVLAMAIDGQRLWAIDVGPQFARLFVAGQYSQAFRLPTYNVFLGYPTANAFAFDVNRVVIPAHPHSGHLAAVFSPDGTLIRHVGELLPETEELARRVPGINDTLWLRDETHWYSIHKFYPLVTVYNRDFEIVNQFQVGSRFIEPLFEEVLNFLPREQRSTPSAIFTDAKLHDGALYLMSSGVLHRVALASGQVEKMYAFYGTGPDFEDVTMDRVVLYFFGFLNAETLLLAHPAMLWNHDLWTADLITPDRQSRSQME